jgi:hypothetical protein
MASGFVIRRNQYYDSVFLMGVNRRLSEARGVQQTAVLMGGWTSGCRPAWKLRPPRTCAHWRMALGKGPTPIWQLSPSQASMPRVRRERRWKRD